VKVHFHKAKGKTQLKVNMNEKVGEEFHQTLGVQEHEPK